MRSGCAARWPGQAVVEYAVALVLLAPLLVGGVDIGRAIFWYAELASAANEGARVASFDKDTTNITNAAIAKAGSLGGVVTVAITCYQGAGPTTYSNCSSVVQGDTIKVQASTTFTPLTFLMRGIVGSSFPLSAEARRTYG